MKSTGGYFFDDTIEGIENNKRITLDILSTENVFERTGGLLKLPKLAKGQGLLINKCNSIHTFGMAYNLDVVYLNRDYKIVKLISHMAPRRMSLCLNAKHTLELLSGEITVLGLQRGMTLFMEATESNT